MLFSGGSGIAFDNGSINFFGGGMVDIFFEPMSNSGSLSFKHADS